MTSDPRTPPRPVRAPEWVGEGGMHQDVSKLSDRGIATLALDLTIKLTLALKRLTDEFTAQRRTADDEKTILLADLSDQNRRIKELEVMASPRERHAYRDEAISSHEWNKALEEAGAVLSQRVKDPHDRLDSARAREIAREVVSGAKTAEDAQSFRKLKSRGWMIAVEIAKILGGVLLGALAARYGLKGLSP
jgi:hypothetical protein